MHGNDDRAMYFSENYAEKINKAADKDEHLTYEEVKKDLGDNVVTDAVAFGVGFVVAVKGCESWDDVEDKFDNDETVKGLYISIFNNKAVSAEYREITPDDKD